MPVTHLFFTGCMKAGKTKELVRRYKKDSRHKMALKPIIDVRWGVNRTIRSRDDGYVIHDAHVVDDFSSFVFYIPSHIAVVYVDEAQFCTNLYEFMCEMTRRNIQVILSGLDETYTKSSWPALEHIGKIPNSTLKIIKLHAKCDDCHTGVAMHTKKIAATAPSSSQDSIIDPGDHYQAACAACWTLPRH